MQNKTNQRQRILDVSLHLFATRGYAATSIDLIAEQALVSHGLVYHFFFSKEDLLREIINQGFADIRQSLEIYKDKSLPPQQAIEIHITKTFEIIRERSEFWRLLHAIRLQEKAAKPMKTVFKDIVEYITAIFTDIFKSLSYKQPQLEALLFLSQIDGVVMLYLQDPTTPLDKLAKQIIQRYKR